MQGSPHFFLPDSSDVHNPGMTMRKVGTTGAGYFVVVVDADDPSVYDDIVARAAATLERH